MKELNTNLSLKKEMGRAYHTPGTCLPSLQTPNFALLAGIIDFENMKKSGTDSFLLIQTGRNSALRPTWNSGDNSVSPLDLINIIMHLKATRTKFKQLEFLTNVHFLPEKLLNKS